MNTYPICPVCGRWQGQTDTDLAKHLEEAHNIVPSAKPIDYKEALNSLKAKEAELANKEKELLAWEKELEERASKKAKD